jgi:hypothetical protein
VNSVVNSVVKLHEFVAPLLRAPRIRGVHEFVELVGKGPPALAHACSRRPPYAAAVRTRGWWRTRDNVRDRGVDVVEN